MLTIMNDLPGHVLGVRATGKVDKTDIEAVLLPALQEKVDIYDEINYLLVLDTEVGNWTAGAWLEDAKAGLKHFTKWNKIAVVSDQKGVEKFTDMFTLAIPGESKGYTPAELEDAKLWVSAV
ncbi:MAG: STAS/SEC14 domain-containing protein [Pedobacter sp.]|nr:MAG: STAS/SEC14 domain-containing protein [Pedobacter sp.]